MRLRALTLTDVRQFSRPVRVAAMADGLNVLSAPNESGKSTLFEAIRALFFLPHTSRKIAPLRPAVGGNPEIALDIDHEGVAYRLVKRWGKGAIAEVWQGARLIAKSDAAEAWINALTLPADEGGPAGLLWVRQGPADFDQGSASENKAAQAMRRDLMSSVTLEIEEMTGGRRMDRALALAHEELAQLVTQRGAKAGGPLDLARREVEALDTRAAALAEQSLALRGQIDKRRDARKLLADLTAADEEASRQQRLIRAQTAFDAAQRHAQALQTAEAQLVSATLALTEARRRQTARQQAETTLSDLGVKLAEVERDLAKAGAEAATARAALTAATQALTAARAVQTAAATAARAALRAAARRDEGRRHAELSATLARAEPLVAALPAQRAAARTGPDAAALATLEAAAQALALAEGLAQAAAPHLQLTYATPEVPQARLDGQPLPADTPVALTARAILDLPGYGTLTLDPGAQGADPARLDKARTTLSALLASAGAGDLAQARSAAQRRVQAETALRQTDGDLRHLVPHGIEALRDELARLAPAESEPQPALDPDAAQATGEQAEAARHKADTLLEAARALAQRRDEAALRLSLQAEALRDKRREAATQLADLPEAPGLAQALAVAGATHDSARADAEALRGDAPDLAASKATLERARSVITAAHAERARLEAELAGFEATISARAGDGVDEDLADTRLKLGTAQNVLAAHETEVAVLKALIGALETAQAAARERYFAPVLAELQPMLRLLWPESELRFDGDSLLPSALVRGGREEALDTLSGGTREQIALLVRLAFARLLAKSGRDTPVILDDALVYSDDDRLERMFDALQTQAADLQIIVLSCRTRALRALGGHALHFETLES